MKGNFIKAHALAHQQLDWGTNGWHSTPELNGAEQLVLIEVGLEPGKGHNFHKHPQQEEIIFVISGTIEQWIDQEKQVLGPGDSAFIPADVVHASFNAGNESARLLAILGPAIGDKGYELVEVFDQAPWNDLR